MKKIKTKKLGTGDYETTNTSPIYFISKSMDGEKYWTLYDEHYDGGHNGYFSTWETKKDCIEVIKEMCSLAK